MAKPTLTDLASGVMSRLGQLTIQTAKKARVSAGIAAHKSLVEVNKMLDEAIAATQADEAAPSKASAKTAAKAPAKSATKAPAKKPAKTKKATSKAKGSGKAKG